MELQKLLSKARRACKDYRMIAEGDRIAVGLSGGKDSTTLLAILAAMRRFYPAKYDLCAITVDMGLGTNERETEAMKAFCESLSVPYEIEQTRIGELIFDVRKETNPCSLCANMRRGALNNAALRLGCNKVALGHHADDLADTLFLSLFYEGRFSVFSPVTPLERSGLTVIRPMIFIREKEIAGYSKQNPVIHNPCPADKHTRRQYVKDLLRSVSQDVPKATENVINAILHPERNNLFDDSLPPEHFPDSFFPEKKK